MKRFDILIATALIAGVLAPMSRAQFIFTDIDYPGANRTTGFDVSGNVIVGQYQLGLDTYGYIYDGTTFTQVSYSGGSSIEVWGTNGSTHVGTMFHASQNKAFTYDGSTLTFLSAGTGITYARGIGEDGTIVGQYVSSSPEIIRYGFQYDGSAYTTFRHPTNPFSTQAWDVEGSVIVGDIMNDTFHRKGFVYNTGTSAWTTLEHPNAGAGNSQGTSIYGIKNDTMVGTYWDAGGNAHGFLYDGSTWTDINHPNASPGPNGTQVRGFDGTRIVGTYRDAGGTDHGFVTAIPEPGSVILVGICGVAVALTTRRRLRHRARCLRK